MSDKPFNYELDDELLSAYLDGELSADERAGVEARLATDPAAQQLLHELRSVSQSVQALPTESVVRDLSEEIVRRAREAKPVQGTAANAKTPASNEPARPPAAMPEIRIFNSKRSWIWASMALAAGLLIMIVQSGDESANKLPSVASRDREDAQVRPADESARPARREVSIPAAPESPSPPPATVAFDGAAREEIDAQGVPMSAAASSPGEPGGGRLGESIRDGAAADKLTAANQPTGRVGGAAGALGVAAEKQKSESTASPDPEQYFVVHVVAKPDALRGGTFERLLADNKIEFVPQPAKNQPLAFGGGKLAKPAQSKTASNDQLSQDDEIRAAETEMVLVEAPAPAIESCLADLNKNSNDFLSIAVNEVSQSQDRFDAKPTRTKKLAENRTNLTRFNRGAAPIAEKDISEFHDLYKYDFKKLTEPVVNGLPRASGFGGEAIATSGIQQDASSGESPGDKSQPASGMRRARRIETLPRRQAGEPVSAGGRAARTRAGAELAKQPMSQRIPPGSAEAKAGGNGDDLKVLFVFTPAGTPASSAPPDNRPK